MKKQIISLIVAAVAGAFLWWAFSPLLFDLHVDDDAPDSITESGSTIHVGDAQVTDTATTTPASDQTTEASEDTGASRFPIEDTPGHPASGYVRVVETPEEQIIRYEDYDGTNGPDLYVYLAKDLEATEFVDLGLARGNKGNINYGVPLDVDLDDYTYVLTWCKAFGVLFDYAKIN